MREIISSIDIGSSKIKLVVAEIIEDRLNVLCALDEESRGVKKGLIVEPEETSYAIKKLLIKAEEMLGIKITKTIVNIPEDQAEFKIGEAIVTITNEDHEIEASDIVRVLQASIKDNINKNMELVTVIPILYKADGKKTYDPRETRASKLYVRSVIVTVPKKEVYLTAKLLEKCGVEVVDIMLDGIGCYYANKTVTTDTEAGIIIDLGAEKTTISVINKGIIINNLVVPYGGKNIDNDIEFIYKLTSEQSKSLKESLALAHKKRASVKEKENLVNTLGENIEVNQYELSEVVMSRMHEILNLAKNEINYLTKKEISYIIITGGLTEIKDFPYEIESVFGKGAYLGKLNIVGARDNKYSACIGMIKYFDDKLKLREKEYSIFSSDELESLVSESVEKKTNGESILGKVFGMFFDN